jgi:hypothetical protein
MPPIRNSRAYGVRVLANTKRNPFDSWITDSQRAISLVYKTLSLLDLSDSRPGYGSRMKTISQIISII